MILLPEFTPDPNSRHSVLSGIENAVTTPTATKQVEDYQYQVFFLPTDFKRGNTIPELTGIQICATIDNADDFTANFTLEVREFGKWVLLDSGSIQRSHTSGTHVWVTAYFNKPIQISEGRLQNEFRFGVQSDSPIWFKLDGIEKSESTTRPLKLLGINPQWDQHLYDYNKELFEANFDMLIGFEGTPQWERYKSWDIDAYCYLNVFGDGNESYVVHQNDADNAPLYIYFAQNPDGSFARRSMDLKSTTYRDGWIQRCRDILDNGGSGIFVDDVNLDASKMFVRAFGAASQTNFTTNTFYSGTVGGQVGWAALLADFLTYCTGVIRNEYPDAKFIFNTQIFWLEPDRWTDPRAERMITASDWILIEHGLSEEALHSGTGSDTGTNDYALRSVWKFLDKIHSLNRSFIIFSRGTDPDIRSYEMANYLLKRSYSGLPDAIGIHHEVDMFPDFDPVYDMDLGQRYDFDDDGTYGTGSFRYGHVRLTPVDKTSAKIVTLNSTYEKIASKNPVVWYKLDDNADSAGGLTLTKTGFTSIYSGGRFIALTSSDYLSRAHHANFNLGDYDWTLEFDITAPPVIDSGTFHNVMSKGWSGIGGWHIYYHANNQMLNLNGNTDLGTNIPLKPDENARISIAYNSTTNTLATYKNGKLLNPSIAYSAPAGMPGEPFRIHGGPQSTPPSGGWQYGEVVIYNSTLSAADIAEIYEGSPDYPDSSIVRSLLHRVLASTADSGTDFLGNSYRSAVVSNTIDAVKTNTTESNSFWLSKPNPSKFAVESLYFDVSDIDKPTVVDRILLDPITPGVHFNVYYTSEGEPGLNDQEWENKLWNPVYQDFKAERRQEHLLREPITARYVKIEFTHLQAQHYQPGTFHQAIKYKKHPKWVLEYFMERIDALKNTDDVSVARNVKVVFDGLSLAYDYYLDDLKDVVKAPTKDEVVKFVDTKNDKSDQVDAETLDRIHTAMQAFTVSPAEKVRSIDSMLSTFVEATKDFTYPVEKITRAKADVTPVSSLDRMDLVIENQMPVMFFYLTCRHSYREQLANFENDRAYFVGIREIALTREHYTVASDTGMYVEPLSDYANAFRNDFLPED